MFRVYIKGSDLRGSARTTKEEMRYTQSADFDLKAKARIRP
jgi:hypothetical protein